MKSKSLNKDNYGYLFIAPYFIVFIVFLLYPTIYSFILSFMKWDGGTSAGQFVGLSNYKRLVTDTVFYKSVGNTVVIWIVNFIPQLVIALALAVALSNKKLKGKGFFRWVFYLPNLVTMATVGVLFSFLLDWKTGSLNKILMSLHIIKDPVNWLTSSFYTRTAVSFTQWWMWFGYSMIIFMAGMKAIPDELFEAAEVDGASGWQSFWKITLPLLRNTMLYSLVTSLIGGLSMFDVPNTLTNGSGAPDQSILTMVMYLYNSAFKNYNYGYGATVGVGLFVLIFIFVLLSFKVINRKQLYD